MVWLNDHEVMIDCHRKTVNFRIFDKSKVVFYGNRNPRQSCCVTMKQAKRLLRKWCIGYLAYVVDTQQKESKLDQIPVVRRFADVFSKELTGLCDQKIEFLIDLVPGTTPISNYSSEHQYCLLGKRMGCYDYVSIIVN